ncbi:hypothetical protein HK102_013738 [Quaeritorhiza haematococci]|nr:hypothetical protein HK102_013738 [Quaeritorhiza haematococci]
MFAPSAADVYDDKNEVKMIAAAVIWPSTAPLLGGRRRDGTRRSTDVDNFLVDNWSKVDKNAIVWKLGHFLKDTHKVRWAGRLFAIMDAIQEQDKDMREALDKLDVDARKINDTKLIQKGLRIGTHGHLYDERSSVGKNGSPWTTNGRFLPLEIPGTRNVTSDFYLQYKGSLDTNTSFLGDVFNWCLVKQIVANENLISAGLSYLDYVYTKHATGAGALNRDRLKKFAKLLKVCADRTLKHNNAENAMYEIDFPPPAPPPAQGTVAMMEDFTPAYILSQSGAGKAQMAQRIRRLGTGHLNVLAQSIAKDVVKALNVNNRDEVRGRVYETIDRYCERIKQVCREMGLSPYRLTPTDIVAAAATAEAATAESPYWLTSTDTEARIQATIAAADIGNARRAVAAANAATAATAEAATAEAATAEVATAVSRKRRRESDSDESTSKKTRT